MNKLHLHTNLFTTNSHQNQNMSEETITSSSQLPYISLHEQYQPDCSPDMGNILSNIDGKLMEDLEVSTKQFINIVDKESKSTSNTIQNNQTSIGNLNTNPTMFSRKDTSNVKHSTIALPFISILSKSNKNEINGGSGSPTITNAPKRSSSMASSILARMSSLSLSGLGKGWLKGKQEGSDTSKLTLMRKLKSFSSTSSSSLVSRSSDLEPITRAASAPIVQESIDTQQPIRKGGEYLEYETHQQQSRSCLHGNRIHTIKSSFKDIPSPSTKTKTNIGASNSLICDPYDLSSNAIIEWDEERIGVLADRVGDEATARYIYSIAYMIRVEHNIPDSNNQRKSSKKKAKSGNGEIDDLENKNKIYGKQQQQQLVGDDERRSSQTSNQHDLPGSGLRLSLSKLLQTRGKKSSYEILIPQSSPIESSKMEIKNSGDNNNHSSSNNNDANEKRVSKPSLVTFQFYGKKQPKISLEKYICRLVRYINTYHEHQPGPDSAGIRAIMVATVYIKRLCEIHPDFVINAMNVHRLFLAATVLANKCLEDDHPSNAFMAGVGGIDLKDLNLIEFNLFQSLKFNTFVSFNDISNIYLKLDPENPHIPTKPIGNSL